MVTSQKGIQVSLRPCLPLIMCHWQVATFGGGTATSATCIVPVVVYGGAVEYFLYVNLNKSTNACVFSAFYFHMNLFS